MPAPSHSVLHYILAKDGNRPVLLEEAFEPEARLEMRVNTGSISFPPVVAGREAIGDVLVRQFNQRFENVYTLCIAEPPAPGAERYRCPWLVCMSGKEDRQVRVGCGAYDWQFSAHTGLAKRLAITIDYMQILPATGLPAVMGWVRSLAYPWCPAATVGACAPSDSAIAAVVAYLS